MKEKHILVRFDLTKLESIEKFEKQIAKSINDNLVINGYSKFETIHLIDAGVGNDIYDAGKQYMPVYYSEIKLNDETCFFIGREVDEMTLELLKHHYPVNKETYNEPIKEVIIDTIDLKLLGIRLLKNSFNIKKLVNNKKHSNPFKKIINFIKHLPRGAGEALRK